MDKDWFGCFSMLFWCFTKMVGLISFLYGAYALGMVFSFGEGWFGRALFMFALPAAVGFFLLTTDVVYDMATASMRSRQKSGS